MCTQVRDGHVAHCAVHADPIHRGPRQPPRAALPQEDSPHIAVEDHLDAESPQCTVGGRGGNKTYLLLVFLQQTGPIFTPETSSTKRWIILPAMLFLAWSTVYSPLLDTVERCQAGERFARKARQGLLTHRGGHATPARFVDGELKIASSYGEV